MHAPLDQFAARIIRNNEVEIFIKGLLELGVSPAQINTAAATAPTEPQPTAGIPQLQSQWQERLTEAFRALKAVEDQIKSNNMLLRINTDNLHRLINDLHLTHTSTVRALTGQPYS